MPYFRKTKHGSKHGPITMDLDETKWDRIPPMSRTFLGGSRGRGGQKFPKQLVQLRVLYISSKAAGCFAGSRIRGAWGVVSRIVVSRIVVSRMVSRMISRMVFRMVSRMVSLMVSRMVSRMASPWSPLGPLFWYPFWFPQ